MLRKKDIKACLNKERLPIAPAYFFWFDSDFIDGNKSFVSKMKKKYEDDIIQTYPNMTKRALEPLDLSANEFTDEWGCRFCRVPNGVGAHPTIPIINSVSDWEEYREKYIPIIDKGEFVLDASKIVRQNPDKYLTMNIWRTFYERMFMLCGMEELWMQIALEDTLFIMLLRDLKEFTINAIRAASVAGIDAVYLADDWGMQDRLQISPYSWKKHFKPAYADMIEEAHSLGMDVFLHSCGCIDCIVPELIDIKLDVIGNLQPSAVKLKDLSEAYKGQITFFGGLDVQSNLTYGTPETVTSEVEKLTKLFGPNDGGFIFGPSNSIMPDTPNQNVEALFVAIDNCRRA